MESGSIRRQLKFLQENAWIYDFQITRFFVEEVWKNVPREWEIPLLSVTLSQLNDLPYGYIEDCWPDSLKDFIKNCLLYSLPRQGTDVISPVDIDQAMRRGMSPKKEHEVSRMAAVIHQVARRSQCDLILDIGSGLGYLGQILSEKFHYNVIGFESQHSHTVGADRRSGTDTAENRSIKNVTFQLNSNPESVKKFEELILHNSSQKNSALHSDSTLQDQKNSALHSDSTLQDQKNSAQHSDSTLQDQKNSAQHSDSTLQDQKNSAQHSDSTLQDQKNSAQHSDSMLQDQKNSAQHSDSTLQDQKNSTQHSDSMLQDQKNSAQHSDSMLQDQKNSTQHSDSTLQDHGYKQTLEFSHCSNHKDESHLRKGSCRLFQSDTGHSLQGPDLVQTSKNLLQSNNESAGSQSFSHELGYSNSASQLNKELLLHSRVDSLHLSCDSNKTSRDSLQIGIDNSVEPSNVSNSFLNFDSFQTDKVSLTTHRDVIKKNNNSFYTMSAESEDLFQLQERSNALNVLTFQKENDLSQEDAGNLLKTKVRTLAQTDSDSFTDFVNEDIQCLMTDKEPELSIPGPSSCLPQKPEVKCSSCIDCAFYNEKSSNCDQNCGDENRHGDRGVVSPCAVMVGLHCCGDLTPTMLSYYRQVDCVKALCCVSCCYHRMQFDDSQKTFGNFPLSSQVSQMYKEVMDTSWRLNTFSMRLAAQETRARWRSQTEEEHEFHKKSVGYRGILELFVHQRDATYGKVFRKIARKGDFESFTTYLDAAYRRLDCSIDSTDMKKELIQLYEDNKGRFQYIEPITALQVMLQPVLESLIYKDRQLWLLEHGLKCDVVPIFDENLSPRNLALISEKRQ